MSYLEELLPDFRKGAKIRCSNWDKTEFIYCLDGIMYNECDCPISYELAYLIYTFLLSDKWELYTEPESEPDWDYIIKNKCLCWFWCEGEEERRIAGLLADYDSYNSQFGRYKGENIAVTYFDYCRPVRKDEVTFYEDREDE